MDEYMRVIEVGGVKVEVDLRTAKRVDSFRVGDRVKVLKKTYSNKWDSHHGVIVTFDDFKNLPCITVCYIDDGYKPDLKFEAVTAQSEDIELAACNDDVLVDKGKVLARLQVEIDAKRAEVADLERKREYFLFRFGAWFENEPPPAKEEQA